MMLNYFFSYVSSFAWVRFLLSDTCSYVTFWAAAAALVFAPVTKM